jgi:hypothetical protein
LPDLSNPSPAVTFPLEENVLNAKLFVPTTADPLFEVQTKPISALVDPCSTKENAPAASAPVAKSSALAGVSPTT